MNACTTENNLKINSKKKRIKHVLKLEEKYILYVPTKFAEFWNLFFYLAPYNLKGI